MKPEQRLDPELQDKSEKGTSLRGRSKETGQVCEDTGYVFTVESSDRISIHIEPLISSSASELGNIKAPKAEMYFLSPSPVQIASFPAPKGNRDIENDLQCHRGVLKYLGPQDLLALWRRINLRGALLAPHIYRSRACLRVYCLCTKHRSLNMLSDSE